MRYAILLTGQMRANEFNIDPSVHSSDILESWNTYLFTPSFRQNNTFDIYIASENYDLNRIQKYFGDESKIVIAEDIDPGVIGFTDEYKKRPNRYPNPDPSWCYCLHTWQWYRLYIGWCAMNKTGIYYDGVIRLRPDLIFKTSCESIFNNIYENGVELYMVWDLFAIGKMNIMERYCNLIKSMGEYIPGTIRYEFINNGLCSYNTYYNILLHDFGYRYSPELQLLEHLMYWIVYERKSKIDTIVNNAIEVIVILEKIKNQYDRLSEYRFKD